MADRVAVLKDGILQQVGTPDEIYYQPVNVFVAGFMGSPAMNMTEVEFDPQTKQFVREPNLVYDARPLLERFKFDSQRQVQYTLGVRPENVSVSLEEMPDSVPGQVFALEPMGNEVLVAVDVGDWRIIAREEPMFEADIQAPCWLKFDNRQVHLFERESEQRLMEK
jgi:multiple sugar transport system ATP-binding protein